MSNNNDKAEKRTGESIEQAIIIQANSTPAGIRMEYQWVEQHFGRRGTDWQLVKQALLQEGDRSYDVLHIRLADGTEREIHFDITNFFGKF